MTRLPHENRNVVDRPDLPEYELNRACPVTGEVAGLENHHLWRRQYAKSWWVELWDGTVVGNRINLSQSAHYRITVNKARIWYQADGLFYWVENEECTPLRWQPPKYDVEHGRPYERIYDLYETPIIPIRDAEHPVADGEVCPTCERRKPHKKKASSPRSGQLNISMPLDEVETVKELVDSAAEYHGFKSQPHHRFKALLYGVVLLLQQEKGELPI